MNIRTLLRLNLFAFIMLLVVSCSKEVRNEFSLTGKTTGLPNGTVIYLDNADSQTIDLIDSTEIKNNAFVFRTKLPDSPLHVVIRTHEDSNYRFLWLENTAMTFDASSRSFEDAMVTGSKAENLAQPLRKSLQNLSETDQRLKEIEFIKAHPNSIVSAETLSVYATTFGKQQTKELFTQLSVENKSSKYGKIITDYIEMAYEPITGEPFADFEMIDQEGISRKLSELQGQTILLDFWASWCAPCRKDHPNLIKIYNEFKPKGFEIFAVSLDENKEHWLEAIKTDHLSWYHVNDFQGQSSEAALIYGVEGIPDSFLIDANGIIVGRDLRGKELNKELEELLYQ